MLLNVTQNPTSGAQACDAGWQKPKKLARKSRGNKIQEVNFEIDIEKTNEAANQALKLQIADLKKENELLKSELRILTHKEGVQKPTKLDLGSAANKTNQLFYKLSRLNENLKSLEEKSKNVQETTSETIKNNPESYDSLKSALSLLDKDLRKITNEFRRVHVSYKNAIDNLTNQALNGTYKQVPENLFASISAMNHIPLEALKVNQEKHFESVKRVEKTIVDLNELMSKTKENLATITTNLNNIDDMIGRDENKKSWNYTRLYWGNEWRLSPKDSKFNYEIETNDSLEKV